MWEGVRFREEEVTEERRQRKQGKEAAEITSERLPEIAEPAISG